MDISLSGRNLGDELLYLLILAGIILLGGILISRTVKRLSAQALRLNG
jgi:hypothetical protein